MADRTGFFACYHGGEFAALPADCVSAAPSYINSPLTDDLKTLPRYSSEIYAKAIRHCWNVLNSRARPLAQLSQMNAWQMGAWRIISDLEGRAVEWLVRRAALPATADAPKVSERLRPCWVDSFVIPRAKPEGTLHAASA